MSNETMIREYVGNRITGLIRQRNTSDGRAMLAQLRRGIGKEPGELPELWGIFLNELRPELIRKDGVPTAAEWAIYLSLTLFALHQQGNTDPVHCEKVSLGKAAYALMGKDKDDEARKRVLRRFAPIVTAKSMAEVSHHLRGMIQLLKANGNALDYIQLAADLYQFQFIESRRNVQLRWGQDFYCYEKGEEK